MSIKTLTLNHQQAAFHNRQIRMYKIQLALSLIFILANFAVPKEILNY